MKEQICELIKKCNDEETLLFVFMILYRRLSKDGGENCL